MESVSINVQGMSCGHCVSAVEGSVSKLSGVSSVKVDLGANLVEVTFDKEAVSLEKIKAEIEEQGYDVVA
ncbi:copper chaperone CopZ [Bacillus suaedae]|uniref:Copper chaperone CopZ n=1 Tax=Halalkalibacter suaedae TaxID=2822140 RepID=A0A940WR56_9BACI|nr:copper chaperone CopZ [Bacillus suaedae]MBP3950288.1 copper chaperone CopZ [Bacillus suaedae]